MKSKGEINLLVEKIKEKNKEIEKNVSEKTKIPIRFKKGENR